VVGVPDDQVLPQLVHKRAISADGDRPFLAEVGGDFLSYAEVDRAGREWGKSLQDLGAEAGSRVAVMLPTSIDSFLIWLACGWLKAFDVPIHVQYRGAIMRHLLDNSGAEILVIRADLLDALWDIAAELKTLKTVVVVPSTDGDESWRGTIKPGWDDRIRDRDALASGEVPAENGPNYWDIGTITFPLAETGPDDCYYCPLPLSHIAGRVGIYNMALVGGRAVLRERFSVEAYWDDIKDYACTSTIMMGSSAEMLWRRPPSEEDAKTPLYNVLMGPLIPKLDEFRARFQVRVRTQFGMTEAAPPLVSGISNDWDLANNQSCGRVVPGFHCRVADENDEPLGPGEIGELLLRTDEPWLLMAGYWQDPESTAKALRNQWFHTGDAVRYDEDGNFYYVDRIKDTIRRRGENISSFFVEQAINEHPGVTECAVVGVESSFTEQEIHAFIVPKDGAEIDGEEIRAFLDGKLPVFMIPRFWSVIDELPRTSTQRVRKVELRERAQAEHSS